MARKYCSECGNDWTTLEQMMNGTRRERENAIQLTHWCDCCRQHFVPKFCSDDEWLNPFKERQSLAQLI